ncbi:flagellar hook assembly protein FlgD [Desulfothermus naphthae]
MNLDYVGTQNIIGRAETDFVSSTPTGPQSELGEDAFLQLLITQLQLQDPTNPMDDKELTAQLAQFSSLEALNNIQETVEQIASNFDNTNFLSGLNFLGTEIRAPGNEIVKQDGEISQVTYQLNGDSIRTYVNIFDQYGNIVNTIELGAKNEGSYTFQWDGKDFDGNILPDGHYSVYFGAEGADEEPVLINTEVNGKVVGVTKQDSNIILELEDGREVSMDKVESVTYLSHENSGETASSTENFDENSEFKDTSDSQE